MAGFELADRPGHTLIAGLCIVSMDPRLRGDDGFIDENSVSGPLHSVSDALC
jgi:hypothetical protein